MSKCNHEAWEVTLSGPKHETRVCADCQEFLGRFESENPGMRLRNIQCYWVPTYALCDWKMECRGVTADGAQIRYDMDLAVRPLIRYNNNQRLCQS